MSGATKVPARLNRLNRELGKALMKYIDEYSIGAFSGIKKIEPLELLHSLESFNDVLNGNVTRKVLDIMTDALTEIIANETIRRIRKGCGVDSTSTKFATIDRIKTVISKRRLFIIETALVIDTDDAIEPKTKVLLVYDPITSLSRCINGAGVINIASLSESEKTIFKQCVFDCSDITIADLNKIVEYVSFAVSTSIELDSASMSGQNTITKTETPFIFALTTYRNMFDQLYDETKTLINSDKWPDDLEGVASLFARVLLGGMITCAVINGVKGVAANTYTEKISKKFFYTDENGVKPTFTAMITMGSTTLSRTVKISDIVALVEYIKIHDRRQDASVTKYSQAITRMIKLLLDFGAAYTTAILAESVTP